MRFSSVVAGALAGASTVFSLSISQINGPKYLSPYAGQVVTNVKGLVTAKGPNGFFLRSTTLDLDIRSSNSIYVFGKPALANVTIGDIITLNANVTEYRSSIAYIYLTELIAPSNIVVVSQGNKVEPVVIGETFLKYPPTQQYSSLDNGDVLSLPNNSSRISVANPTLQPLLYGLDFWESLSGELVTVKKPTALSKPNQYGDTWVVGSWWVTGKNSRGGVTMTDRDLNPEAIFIGTPLDGSKNPTDTKLGDSLKEITGVVTQTFGYYYILPTTKMEVVSSKSPAAAPPTKLISNGKCSGLTFGDYNVENLDPKDAHLPKIAAHIVDYLKMPSFLFLQEVQDNTGAANDGVVSANQTLTLLVETIAALSGKTYAFASVDPVNNQDGGEPGGNIRTAYFYDPSLLRLRNANPGSSTDANAVLAGGDLKFNPGRIDPNNAAWTASRKPIAAEWETLDGKNRFFTVNVHFGSKGGGSSVEGDYRPPINGGVADRHAQMQLTADFVAAIQKEDKDARIIVSGDYNEFVFVEPVENFKKVSGLVDLDEAAGIDKLERYTYLFDMNCQQLDHIFVSKSLTKGAQYEHIHVNTWSKYADQVSDHDPSVAKLNICQ